MTDLNIYSAMQVGAPFKVYQKTILGKVHIHVLNPFSGKPEYALLVGRPGEEGTRVEIWDEKQDMFLKTMNKKHFKEGRLIEVESKVQEETTSPNQITEEELEFVLNSPFMTIKNKLDSFTSEAPVYRMLVKAQELEKSDKIVKRIEARLAELQLP